MRTAISVSVATIAACVAFFAGLLLARRLGFYDGDEATALAIALTAAVVLAVLSGFAGSVLCARLSARWRPVAAVVCAVVAFAAFSVSVSVLVH